MPSNNAHTPKNRWGITIPAAAYGAEQLPVPQPATMGEVETEAYRDKLTAAMWAQIEANAQALKDRRAKEGARPYRPGPAATQSGGAAANRMPVVAASAPGPTPSAPPARPAATVPAVRSPGNPADAAATASASALLTGSGYATRGAPAGASADQFDREYDRGRAEASGLLSGEGLASATAAARPAIRPAATGSREQQEASGAAAVVALIGTPEQQRANRAAQSSDIGAGGSDASAGAAEARRLLGQN